MIETLPILAQAFAADTMVRWIVIAIVFAGIVGIFLVVIRQAGVEIPGWIIQILWIVLAVVVSVVAIKFLWGFMF